MGYIRETKLKKGGTRYQAEVRLKGHPTLTAMFDRKTDAKAWVQKVEADIRAGRHQLYSEGRLHTFKEAIERYFKEQPVSVVKRGHLLWWQKELGALCLKDVRPSIITEKKQKLLTEPNAKGVIRSKSANQTTYRSGPQDARPHCSRGHRQEDCGQYGISKVD